MEPAVVLHIPHASRYIPPGVRPALLLDDAALARELTAVTDAFVDELFALPGLDARRVVFPVSRLVVDPERFADDEAEPMARRGLGVIYEATSSGGTLRAPPTPDERAALLESYYAPHHRAVREAVAAGLPGRVVLLDLHSFASRPLPLEPDQDPDRPQVCLGTHPAHTPPALASAAAAAFAAEGFRTVVDRPYAGVFVPAPYWGVEKRVLALMIEVNRALYLNEANGARSAAFAETRERLGRAVTRLVDFAARLPEVSDDRT